MDREQILLKFKGLLSEIDTSRLEVEFGEHSVIYLTVISNDFKGMHLSKRLLKISSMLLDVTTNELADYGLKILALTENEDKFNIPENKPAESIKKRA